MSCDPWAGRRFVPDGYISVLAFDRISVNENEPVSLTDIDVESILIFDRAQVRSGHPKGRRLQFPNGSIARLGLVADGVSADIVEPIASLEKPVKLGLELITRQPVSDFQRIELGLNDTEQETGPSESEWGEELHHLWLWYEGRLAGCRERV